MVYTRSFYHPRCLPHYVQKRECSEYWQKKEKEMKKREQRHTWLAGKMKACRRKSEEGGAAAAPRYVHHNDSSKDERW